MHKGFKFFSTVLLFVTLFYTSLSQEVGRYPLRNFGHREYRGHSQNWAVVQDHRGLIYVANNYGVLEYDGDSWRNISINGALARALDVDRQGRIWVDGQDELGYLAANPKGEMIYHSLVARLPSECFPLGLVRQVFSTPQGVFFSTNQWLFQITDNEIFSWKASTSFHRTYYANGVLFANQPGLGLFFLDNGELNLVPEGHCFNESLIYSITSFDKDRVLLGTQQNGFFLYNLKALKPEVTVSADSICLPFKTSNDKFFKDNRIYFGTSLPNNLYGISTFRGGAAIMDSNGKIVRYINKETGLQDDAVWYLYADNQHNIWFALNNGISYTPITSHVTYWDENSELSGVLSSVARFNDKIYVSTNIGIYYLENNEFVPVKHISTLSWGLLNAKAPNGKNHLLAATGEGIFIVQNGNTSLIQNGRVPAFKLYQSKAHPDIIYVGQYDGIGIIRFMNNRWVYLGSFPNVEGEVHSILEDSGGTLWFSQRFTGVWQVKDYNPYSRQFFKIKIHKDLPNNPKYDDITMQQVQGEVKVSTEKGLCKYDPVLGAFVADASLGIEFADGSTGLRIFAQDSMENLWFEAFKESPNRWIERAIRMHDGTYRRRATYLKSIPEMIFYDVLPEGPNNAWIAGSDGLYYFSKQAESIDALFFTSLIRNVLVNQTESIFSGAFYQQSSDTLFYTTSFSQPLLQTPVLPYSQNSLTFLFSSPYFGAATAVRFSYKLEGYDNEWSPWLPDRKKEYTNLPNGTYRFMVKAHSALGEESPAASFSFTIDRPWFKQPWAFLVYGLLMLFIIYLSVRFKTRLLKRSNLRLQTLVNIRTSEILKQQEQILDKNNELSQQKEELMAQRDALESQNKSIHASLQYAQTIQQAILPRFEPFADIFEHFLFFRPKDVVSGDFYWTARVKSKGKRGDKIFAAVVDCTGHGVPGAFMSMIGSRLLSEIVVESGNHNPEDILDELNLKVNSALNQDYNENFDGMDICLCLIEPFVNSQYLVTFAGANRPLYYLRKSDEKVQTIKGNRKSIGGVMPDIEATFVNKKLTLASGDMLILATDGIVDQNNVERKKFAACRFHSAVAESAGADIVTIGQNLEKAFEAFRGITPQRDDITVLGLRLK